MAGPLSKAHVIEQGNAIAAELEILTASVAADFDSLRNGRFEERVTARIELRRADRRFAALQSEIRGLLKLHGSAMSDQLFDVLMVVWARIGTARDFISARLP